MDEDLIAFAATFDTAVNRATVAAKTRDGVIFITARPKGHPAIPSQADFLRDLEPVCPERLRMPHAVLAGDAGRCRAHGDFVPWNLATDGDVLYAWDWTRAMREAPWPFDAIHYC